MEEVVWNIRVGKFNIRWNKVYYPPFIKYENGKDFLYFSIYKVAFVVFK